VKGGETSLRKISLAIREEALGYRTPQLLPLPSVKWPPCRLPRPCGQNTPPPTSHLGPVRGAGAPAPRWGRVPLVAHCGPRLPLQVGGGSRWVPPGVRQVGGPERACAVCVRSAPCGVVSLGAKGGRCWGARRLVGPRFPSPQTWCRRAYCARPLSPSRSQWQRAVMVGAALLESVIPRMSSLRVAD